MRPDLISRRAGLLGMLSVGLGGCMPHTYRSRCRLTVFVEVDGRSVSASAVTEQTTHDQIAWLPTQGGIMSETRGEGVILSLGGNRILVAGLRGMRDGHVSTDSWSALHALASLSDHRNDWRNDRNPAYDDVLQRRPSGPADVPKTYMPMFIEFPNRHQPEGGIVHDPETLAGLGANGIVLTRATLEVTRDRIFTGKPQKTFPWLLGALEASRHGIGNSDQPYYASDLLLPRWR